MVSQLAAAVTTFLFNRTMMKLLGEDGVAAITVIIYSQFLLTTLYIGFSMGVAPIISYHFGSENGKQIKKVVRICFALITAVSVIVFLFSFFAGEIIAKIFVGNHENVYEILNLGESTPITLNEMIETIEEAVGKKAVIERREMQPGDVNRTYADITKAKQLINYMPKTSFREGIQKFVSWYLDNRHIYE